MLKLFRVDVESFLYVLAETSEQAEDLVRDGGGGIIEDEILEDCVYFARKVERAQDIDQEWKKAIPYVDEDYEGEDYNDVEDMICEEFMEKYEEEQEKIKNKAEQDKLQLKLGFEKEIITASEKIGCHSCGYTGDIGTFEPTISAYSDIRCPKCKSTNCDHNSEYLKELMTNMNKEKNEKV